MIKQFDKQDIDTIMRIWKNNNQSFQSFVPNDYWVNNYIKYRDEFLNTKVYVYTEATQILAYIAINDNDEIINIQVLPQIQREGIGKLLVDKVRKETDSLLVRVFEKNNEAVLFFKALGFKKMDAYIDDTSNERCYLMRWGAGESGDKSFIYFNNSIKRELIEKYDLESKVHFYNIYTVKSEANDILNISIADNLEISNNQTYIKDYISVRNKLNSIMKTENVIIYFDCNSTYEYLYDLIKDIAKVRNAKLSIVMHKPFSVEGTKKQKIYDSIASAFKGYNFVEVDYATISEDLNISFKDAFDKRDEEMLKAICFE